jgi:hypothetical protein
VIGFLQEGQVHVGYHRPICFLGFLLRFGRTWGKRGFLELLSRGDFVHAMCVLVVVEVILG